MATCIASGCVLTVCLPNLLQALPYLFKRVKCRCNCTRIDNDFGVVLFQGEDRTTLINNLMDIKQHLYTIFLDLDQLVQNELSSEQKRLIQSCMERDDFRTIGTIILPIAQRIRKEMLVTYKNKRIIWFANSINLFHFMEIHRVFPYLPQSDYESTLRERMNEHEWRYYEAHKYEIFRSIHVPNVYTNKEHLGEQICKLFDLTFVV